jgi:molecular chaperone GrpE
MDEMMNDPKNNETQSNGGQGTSERHKADAYKPEASQRPTSSLSQPGAESEIGEPEPFTELENLYTENAGLKDKLLRALADMENLRRRTEREVSDAKSYGATNFAREMLALADNLQRAIDTVPQAERQGLDAKVVSLIEGVELIERDFHSRLARFGVKRLEPLGGRFDPNLHEALFEIPDESKPAGTVAQVIEPGYTIGERVLRPAKVGVTRGGPKA